MKKQQKAIEDFLNRRYLKDDIDFEERIINSDLVSIVRKLIKREDWNQEIFAKKLDVSPAFISKLFSGEKRFNVNLLAKIQILFEVRFKFDLFEDIETKKTNTMVVITNTAKGFSCEIGEISDLNPHNLFSSANLKEEKILTMVNSPLA